MRKRAAMMKSDVGDVMWEEEYWDFYLFDDNGRSKACLNYAKMHKLF